MKHYFAICDQDETYVRRFSDYVNETLQIPYPMQAFTNFEALEQFCRQNIVDLLLVEEELWTRCKDLTGVECVVKLTERNLLTDKTAKEVYKYQSAQTLMTQVMSNYKEQDGDNRKEGRNRIIGIYSPVRRSLKTSFGLALGQILSRDQSVLFISMETFSGMFRLWKEQKTSDLSDILYYIRQGKSGMSYWAESCIYKLENLDCIFPPLSPLDLQGAEEKDWLTLLEELKQNQKYHTIILDIDESCGVLLPFLKSCHCIYTPVLEDMMSRGKIEQYETFLRQTGNEDILDKTTKIKPPFYKGKEDPAHYIEELVWGELGDYVRKVVWGSNTGRKAGKP